VNASIARSRRGGDYALLRNTRAALTRALKIYHLARVLHRAALRVPNRVVGQALNAQRSEGSDGL